MTFGVRSSFAYIVIFLAWLIMGCASQRASLPVPASKSVLDADSLCAMAAAAASEKNYTEAKSLFEEALAIDPQHIPSLRGSASLHEEINDPRSAKSYYEQLVSSASPAPGDFLGLARTCLDLSDETGALTVLEKAAARFPNNFDVQYRLGLLYADRSRLREASLNLKKALRINPQSTDAMRALGDIEFDMQNYEEAGRLLESYLAAKPTDFRSNMRVGYIYFQAGEFDRALPFYRQAVDADPSSVDARVALASTLEKLDRLQAAVRTYREALDVADDLSNMQPVLLALADLLNRQREFESTVSLLQNLPANLSHSPGLSCALGIALAGEGHYEQAITAFERAVGHARWGSFAAEQINKLKKLKSYDAAE